MGDRRRRPRGPAGLRRSAGLIRSAGPTRSARPTRSAFGRAIVLGLSIGLAAVAAEAGSKSVEGRAYLLRGDEKLKFKGGAYPRTKDPEFQLVIAFPPEDPGTFLMTEFEVPDDDPGEPIEDEDPVTFSGTYKFKKSEREVRPVLDAEGEAALLEALADFIDEVVFGEDQEGDTEVTLLSQKWEAELNKKLKKMELEARVKVRASSEQRGETWTVTYRLDLRGKRIRLETVP